jgi:hypothetical protein
MDGVIIEKIPINRFLRKRVKFHFGMWVWTGIADKYGQSLDDLGKVPQDKVLQEAFFFAAQWAAFKDGKRFRMSFEKMEKAVELMPQGQLKRITKCMLESKVGGETLFQTIEKSKKKRQSTKSKTSQ